MFPEGLRTDRVRAAYRALALELKGKLVAGGPRWYLEPHLGTLQNPDLLTYPRELSRDAGRIRGGCEPYRVCFSSETCLTLSQIGLWPASTLVRPPRPVPEKEGIWHEAVSALIAGAVGLADAQGADRKVSGPRHAPLDGRAKNLPFGERYGQIGAVSIRRYTNHEDQSGSPIYMQARMCLPIFGKFAQVDPGYDQFPFAKDTWSLYSYIRNNPIMATDPNGMDHYWVVVNESDSKRFAMVYVTREDGSLRAMYEARAMGLQSAGHQRNVSGGDTPYGTAHAGRIMTRNEMENQYGKETTKSYGNMKINLIADSGELLTTGRASAGVAVHGGGKALIEHWFDANQALLNTEGCLRMHNKDVEFEGNEMKRFQKFGVEGVFHVGTAESLRNEARALQADVPQVWHRVPNSDPPHPANSPAKARPWYLRAWDNIKRIF